MTFQCVEHTAYLYDRGGTRQIGEFNPLSLVRWSRVRDDVSTATVHVPVPDNDCNTTLGIAEPGRHELVIFRGDERVWEGPISHINRTSSRVEISARDVLLYCQRTAMHNEYNNSYPNVTTVLARVDNILTTELARKESLDPPVNILPYVTLHPTGQDAKTTAHTRKFEMTVFDHIDTLAARGGLDYTVVGRAIHLFDVDTSIGRTPPVTAEDFIGEVVVTSYGMELVTRAIITDGLGNAGLSGGPGIDSYYGEWEVVHGAYDEGTDPGDDVDPPTVEEMESQANRIRTAALPTPTVVRIPDGSRLNPQGVLSIRDLVPGVRVPLLGLPIGREFFQLQKLDQVVVEESGGGDQTEDVGEGVGEAIRVTLSPAPLSEQ